MKDEERVELIEKVFAPRAGEKVLLLVDVPHGALADTPAWATRREMASEWAQSLRSIVRPRGVSVEILPYPATGKNNAPIPAEVIDRARGANLVLAMTEFSASSSLKPVCDVPGTVTRCASMPKVARAMEETAFKADYAEVGRYAAAIEMLLNRAVGAEVEFSTSDRLYLDLRHRTAGSDRGDCRKAGQFINFPSGEGFKVPYEATPQEAATYGQSKTEGVIPVFQDTGLYRYVIQNNRIEAVLGDGSKAEEQGRFFAENESRRNIAELGSAAIRRPG